jgi:hypothetical protein
MSVRGIEMFWCVRRIKVNENFKTYSLNLSLTAIFVTGDQQCACNQLHQLSTKKLKQLCTTRKEIFENFAGTLNSSRNALVRHLQMQKPGKS